MVKLFAVSKRWPWVLAVVMMGLSTLTGCAKTKILSKAEDIHVYDDSNVVFLGYDIYIPDSRIQGMYFICKDESPRGEQKPFACFPIKTVMGKTRYKGSALYKMQFGKYKITQLEYVIKTGTKRTTYTTYKGGIYQSSYTIDSDVDITCHMYPSFYKYFTVSPENSPYIGHYIIYGKYSGNNCAPAEHSTVIYNFGEDVKSLRNKKLQKAARGHIDFLNS